MGNKLAVIGTLALVSWVPVFIALGVAWVIARAFLS